MNPRDGTEPGDAAGGGDRRTAREAQLLHEVATRAVRRLDLFEWVMIAAAAAVALGGGGLVALLLAPVVGLPVRVLWLAVSLLIFAVPGAMALRNLRREDRREK